MPRIGNLQNCKIYKIVSMNNPELVYYGHTCQTLAQRFSSHKKTSNTTTSKQIIDKGDAMILLVENYPCISEDEANVREAFYILNNPCINKQVPGQTHNEWYEKNRTKCIESMKKYDEAHKEQKKEYDKQYREINKERIQQNRENIKERKKQSDKLRYQKNKLALLNINNNANQEINQTI